MAQMVKCPLAMRETWVRSLGGEDSLEKEMATHSSILAWKIPWTEESGELQSMGPKESDMTERLHFHFISHSTPPPPSSLLETECLSSMSVNLSPFCRQVHLSYILDPTYSDAWYLLFSMEYY